MGFIEYDDRVFEIELVFAHLGPVQEVVEGKDGYFWFLGQLFGEVVGAGRLFFAMLLEVGQVHGFGKFPDGIVLVGA